jgi:chromosome segregation ATPase
MHRKPTVLNPEDLFENLDRQRQVIIRAGEALREHRLDLTRMLAGVEGTLAESHAKAQTEIDNLRGEFELLQQLLTQTEQARVEAEERCAVSRADAEETERLRIEATELRHHLVERDALLADLRETQITDMHGSLEDEVARYEAELNDFHRELELEKQSLNEQLEQVRRRNQELHDMAREAELELSRERAQLARERAQISRVREEIRQEIERAQRHAEVESRLAPLQRLQEEMTERSRQTDASRLTETPIPRDYGSKIKLWRALMDKLNDSSTPAR